MEEHDLSRMLRDLSSAPRIEGSPVAVDQVAARVHRGRVVRGGGLAAVCLAAVVGLGSAVWAAAPWESPAPPADPPGVTVAPTPDPGPTPLPTTPTESPEPSAEPAPPASAVAHPLVVITVDGALVLVEPPEADGASETRVVVEGLSVADPGTVDVSVAPDGEVAYVSQRDSDGAPEVVAVDLRTGAVDPVARGLGAAVSPDGSTLAFVGPDPSAAAEETWGLTFLDLASGDVRHLPDEPFAYEDGLWDVAWSRNGTHVVLSGGWFGARVTRLPVDAASLEEAVDLGPDPATGLTWESPTVLADDTVAVAVRQAGYEPAPERFGWSVVDPSSGEVLESHIAGDTAAGTYVSDLAAHPTSRRAALLVGPWSFDSADGVGWQLALWDGTDLDVLGGRFVAVAW